MSLRVCVDVFFFQAEDGIRDLTVTGVQTCALPIFRPPPGNARPKNRLLARLPDADFRRIQPHLKMVVIRPKQILHRPGEPLEYVYFPNGGVFSVTTLLPNGTAVEAATVGDEGMVGIEAFFSDDAVAPGQTLLQVPD